MRHRISNTVIEVFGKNIWVIADQPMLSAGAKHPGSLPFQIEQHIDGVEGVAEDRFGLPEIL